MSNLLRMPAALLLLATAPAARAADELPPNTPRVPFHGVYEVQFADDPGAPQPLSFKDTVRVWVSGQRVRQDAKVGQPRAAILDLAKNEVLEWDPEDPKKIVERVARDEMPVVYLEGSAVFEDFGAPEAVGVEQVAGQPCTLLRFGDAERAGALACVTKDGIVSRAQLKLPEFERSWRATELRPGPQPDERFAPPQGFEVPPAQP